MPKIGVACRGVFKELTFEEEEDVRDGKCYGEKAEQKQ